ncbi:MAG: hypothetical protein ACP5HK_05400 [Acidilobus sp.]
MSVLQPLLLTLILITNGGSVTLHNGTLALPKGPVIITLGSGLGVAEFNSTASTWYFNITKIGRTVAVIGTSGVRASLIGVWVSPFANGLMASVELCANSSSPPAQVYLWQGTTEVKGVPGANLLVNFSRSSCGERLLIRGNSTELSYLTYFTEYSWTTFEVTGGNWSVVVTLGEASQSASSAPPPAALTTPYGFGEGAWSSMTYVPLIISGVALAIALVSEIAGRRGD